jgi:hypothetical protein
LSHFGDVDFAIEDAVSAVINDIFLNLGGAAVGVGEGNQAVGVGELAGG